MNTSHRVAASTRRGMGPRLVLALAFVFAPGATGCTTWAPTTDPPLSVVASERPRVVRITDDAGRETIVNRPSVRDSAIVGEGHRSHCYVDLDARRRCLHEASDVEIDVRSVERLELRVPHRPGHSALIGGVAALSTVLVFTIGTGGGCFAYDARRCTELVLLTTGFTTVLGGIVGTISRN